MIIYQVIMVMCRYDVTAILFLGMFVNAITSIHVLKYYIINILVEQRLFIK